MTTFKKNRNLTMVRIGEVRLARLMIDNAGLDPVRLHEVRLGKDISKKKIKIKK